MHNIFTKDRPPILKASLGVALGYIPHVVIRETSVAGAPVTLSSSLMLQVGNTSTWFFDVQDNSTLPTTLSEFAYSIHRGSISGDVVDSGTYTFVISEEFNPQRGGVGFVK